MVVNVSTLYPHGFVAAQHHKQAPYCIVLAWQKIKIQNTFPNE